jgi:hypothetical protein
MKPTSVFLSLATLAAAALAAPSTALAAPAKGPAKPHDFNGDGRADLVINAHRSVKRGDVGPGAVAILYGKTNRKQVITGDSRGVKSVADHGDRFGESTASADFDRDGYADLAITGPNEDGVTIVYGSKKGLSSRAAFLRTVQPPAPWSQHLAVGDFDKDGHADLVATSSGRYWVFHKVGKGTKPSSTVGTVTINKRPVLQLIPAVGDFDGDGRPDLVLGSSAQNRAFLLKNSAKGLGTPTALQGVGGIHALAAGDFNGDGRDDLVSATWNGVKLQLGGPSGPGKPRTVEGRIGKTPITRSNTHSLAVGDVDRDGRDDLVIGAPYGGPKQSGQVVVLRGHKGGLTTRGGQVFSQKTKGIKGTPEARDDFGWAVRLLDLSGDRGPELAIGSPRENGKGRVYVLRNSKRKIVAKDSRRYHQKDFGLTGTYFGYAFQS